MWAISLPLVVTFCAFFVFNIAYVPLRSERLQLVALLRHDVRKPRHAKEDDVVNGLHCHDQCQISRFVEGDAQDDAGCGRKEELVGVGVARVHGAEDHARDKDARGRTASLNELRLQEDTKEQFLERAPQRRSSRCSTLNEL